MSLSPDAQHELNTVHRTFGAALIGAFVAMILYGLTCLQTYIYFAYSLRDTWKLKSVVGGTWFFDTVHTILVAICIYHYLIVNFHNPEALSFTSWYADSFRSIDESVDKRLRFRSLPAGIILNATIALIVNFFFVVRIFRLCGKRVRWWFSGVTGVISIAHFAFAIETSIYLLIRGRLISLDEHRLQYGVATPFAITAILSNLLITIALCLLLSNARTGFKNTDTMVSTLIAYALHRCVLLFLVVAAEAIAYKAAPHDLWWIAIDFSVGKLYANSLLTTLNSRESIRSKRDNATDSFHMSRIVFEESSSMGQDSSRTTRPGNNQNFTKTRPSYETTPGGKAASLPSFEFEVRPSKQALRFSDDV
ncbi:hypothetical protein D9619_009385 [Psilocybe cf. subviscida]|uniref:DUF6534 domain-containing protein n=1 Tax=Psilocybe cf. subviscida TaxID=2480587 RepID=A0A8H5BWF4_9AGAR|nr:hypothetical protein D9619_009385 [Psilocybe cf. subviscida]